MKKITKNMAAALAVVLGSQIGQAQCPTPTLVTSSPTAICAPGGAVNLNASTNPGLSINWYTVATGGVPIGSSAPGANFNINTVNTTTYYAESASTSAIDFTFTGAPQTFVIPSGITGVLVETWGAEGGGSTISNNSSSGPGGKGGYAAGILGVSPGNTLNIYVGGFGMSSTTGNAPGGYNGGGQGYASGSSEPGNGGGGASDVRLNGVALSDRVIVAGGGGGGGEDSGDSVGDGGGLTGVGYSAYDATQTAAGAGGGIGVGGGTNQGDGGGGGGGYYGGGTLSSSSVGGDTQGGGGGSGYIGGVVSGTLIAGDSSMPNPTGGSMTGNSNDGHVRITYITCASPQRAAIVVTVNPSPTITVNSGTICAGESFTIIPSGAASYSFAGGSDVVTPLSNTNYTVVGYSTEGCASNSIETSSVIVNSNPVITSNSGTICVGESFTINALGASTYTYGTSPSNVVSPSVTTSYNVLGTSPEGCVSNTPAVSVVTVIPGPSITVNSSGICLGESFTVVPNGAFSYTYSNGSAVSTPTANVSYTVSGSDFSGCVGYAVCDVTVNPIPNVSASANSNTVCEGSEASITASGATTYTWNTGATSAVLVVVPSSNTTYTVTGETNGCVNTAMVTQNVVECVGLKTLSKTDLNILIYPNPSNGTFKVELANGLEKTIEVLDVTGRTILSNTSNNDVIDINMVNLSDGIYYAKIQSNNTSQIIKVIKQ